MFSCNLPPALQVWRNDRDLLRATVVTSQAWNGYQNKGSAQKADIAGEDNSPAAPAGTRTRYLSLTSPALYH